MDIITALYTDAGIVELQLNGNNTYEIVKVSGNVQKTLVSGVYAKNLRATVSTILDNNIKPNERLIVIQE